MALIRYLFFARVSRLLTCAIAVCGFGQASGQTFAEFFKQKKTQRKYLLEQIAALQMYVGYARQGYQIAKQGLEEVKDYTGTEMKLHQVFFKSRKELSPTLAGSKLLVELLEIRNQIATVLANPTSLESFNADEQMYINGVWGNLHSSCQGADADFKLFTGDILGMDDNERLQRLTGLLSRYQEILAFGRYFTGQLIVTGKQHRYELKSIIKTLKYYEIQK